MIRDGAALCATKSAAWFVHAIPRAVVLHANRFRDAFVERIEDTAAGCLFAADRAAKLQRLAGNDGTIVVAGMHDVERVVNPGHRLLVGIDIGRRDVSVGPDRVAKLDHATFEVLTEFPIKPMDQWPTDEEIDEAIAKLDALDCSEGVDSPDCVELQSHALQLATRYLQGLDGVYAMLDTDNTLYVGGGWMGNRLAFIYKDLVPDSVIVDEMVAIFAAFKANRNDGESLGEFCTRVGKDDLAVMADAAPKD